LGNRGRTEEETTASDNQYPSKEGVGGVVHRKGEKSRLDQRDPHKGKGRGLQVRGPPSLEFGLKEVIGAKSGKNFERGDKS